MLLRACVLASFLIMPMAAAEGFDLQVVGARVGWNAGVAGFQWDDEGAVGMRYWRNMTDGDEAALLLTTCISTDAHLVYYCERHALSP